MTYDEIIKEAVKLAQTRAAKEGLTIGQAVAHPDEPVTCELLSVDGDTATIGWKDIKHPFPLRELFDPNVAKSTALSIQEELKRSALVMSAPFN